MSDTETVEPVKKQRPGTFSSTHQPKHRRTADRIPHNVKADVVAGLAAHGEDGAGKGGFRGYITHLARKHPKQAARLVERLLPPSVVVANSSPGATIRTVNIVSVPSNHFSGPTEMRRLTGQDGLPMLLEHEPQPGQLEQLEQLAEFCEASAAPAIVNEPALEPPARPSEHDLILQRARTRGYTPLPLRPRQED